MTRNSDYETETLSLQMQSADAHYDAGRWKEAEQTCVDILRISPERFDCLTLYGIITAQTGRAGEAREIFGRAIAAKPLEPSAHNNLGNVLLGIGHTEEALLCYERALVIDPNFIMAHNNRGNALSKLQRFAEAIASYDLALSLRADYAEALNNRGVALERLDRPEEALRSYEHALRYRAEYAEAQFNRANVLRRLRRLDDALCGYAAALRIKPDYAEASYNQGIALQEANRISEALESYSRALALKPDCPWLYGSWLYTRKSLCEWTDLNRHLTVLAARIQAGMKSAAPFHVLALLDSADLQLRGAQVWMNDNFPPRPPCPISTARSSDKIRLAYLSDDLRDHALTYLMAGVFEQHDRSEFEVTAISFRGPEDTTTGRRVRLAFDTYIDVHQMSDLQVAQMMRDMEVDIAVDLMGATLGARVGIFAYRPAPLQVNYLGYPGTLGTSHLDYLIADDFVIPDSQRVCYSEAVVYLPDCFQATDEGRTIPSETLSRRDAGLPEDAFVYCSFNAPYKLCPEMFDVWCRLLRAQPHAVLWLLAGTDAVRSNLRREAQARDVDPQRIVFADWLPYEQHLARMRLADLFLDSLPFNAGASASAALWAGVPMVTCCGHSFAARMGGSLLRAIGLPELITYSLDDYERLARHLATDSRRLAALRARLAANRSCSPLFDTGRFCRNLESAYRLMHERRLRGMPTGQLVVPSMSRGG